LVAHRSDAGHDLALRQMPVAHQPAVASICQLVGMAAEEARNSGGVRGGFLSLCAPHKAGNLKMDDNSKRRQPLNKVISPHGRHATRVHPDHLDAALAEGVRRVPTEKPANEATAKAVRAEIVAQTRSQVRMGCAGERQVRMGCAGERTAQLFADGLSNWSRICRTPSRPRRARVAVECGRASADAAKSARQTKDLKAKLLIGNKF
jgi:hypothetical protein